MAVEFDATTLDRYLDDDLELINNGDIWQEYKHGKKHKDDICYLYKIPGDSVWWIKMVAYIENGSLANIDDLLDANLKERHSEWHDLAADGRIIRKNDDGRSEIRYFQFTSPSMFFAPRDTCYIKVRRNLSNGFLLSYRSIDVPEAKDPTGKFVRINFTAAHLIEKSDKENGFIYTYIQYADPGGYIPKGPANRAQIDVMFNEVEGIRRAMENPIQSKQ